MIGRQDTILTGKITVTDQVTGANAGTRGSLSDYNIVGLSVPVTCEEPDTTPDGSWADPDHIPVPDKTCELPETNPEGTPLTEPKDICEEPETKPDGKLSKKQSRFKDRIEPTGPLRVPIKQTYKTTGRAAKFIPGVGVAVTALFGLFDGVTAGLEEAKKEGATKLSIMREGVAGTLSGLTFGLVSQEGISGAMTKVSEGFTNALNKSSESVSKLWTSTTESFSNFKTAVQTELTSENITKKMDGAIN